MNEDTHSVSDLSAPPITFRTLWQRLTRQKLLVSLMGLVGLLLAGLLTQMITPAYRAVATLHIQSTPAVEPSAAFHAHYQQVQSRELIARVIDELNLESRLFNKDFRTPLRIAAEQRIETMFGDALRWAKAQFSDSDHLQSANRPDRVEAFLERLYTEPDEKAQWVHVAFESPDSELSAEIANALVGSFILKSRKKDLRSANPDKTLLQFELDKAKQQLSRSEEALLSYEQDNDLTGLADDPLVREKNGWYYNNPYCVLNNTGRQ